MTYYEKYNVYILFASFMSLATVLIWRYYKKIGSLIDPLVLHLISIASILSLLIGYIHTNNFSFDSLFFLLVYIIYVPFLYIFLKNRKNENFPDLELNKNRLYVSYFVSLLLVLYSRYDFILYAYDKSFLEWFWFRFKLIEGRNPLQYICRLGGTSFFYYYSFTLIRKKNLTRVFLLAVLLVILIIDILSGGRSSMINLLISYGLYLYKYPANISVKYLRRINLIGILSVLVSILLAVVVTAMYDKESSIEQGLGSIINRILAAGDGLEMYLVNDADRFIDSGIFEYIKSTFGIFVTGFFGIPTKSLGWRLYELDKGYDTLNSVGPNFLLALQVAVIGKYLILPYVVLSAYITAKFRDLNIKGHEPINYAVSVNCFYISTDIEFATLIYVSTIAIYMIFFLPVKYFTIRLPKIRFSI
ncbi:hypothetical protein GGR92_002995 [Spirosoma lacussanchae]|uniref:hypothetical protein n=1 Tax=Spirosoma lacussanchae TaxID=1884249 RepID=UPI00110816F8|nr:hypothetical protein [Spirosoma lacussanchae]